jgi:hypothetical protein
MIEMKPRGYALTATLCAVLALGACSSTRLGGFGGSSVESAAPVFTPDPVQAVPSGPIESAPLAPIDGQPLPPYGGAPMDAGTMGSPYGTDIASLPPVAPPPTETPAPAPASRTSMVGSWSISDAAGDRCRIQLSSSPALDLYKASTSGCSNQDLSKVNAWDYRGGEVYLYQTGGAVAARLRGGSSSLSGVLAKSGAPISLVR